MVYSAEAAQFHPLIHPHLEDLQVAADEASVPIELHGRNTALRGYTFQLIKYFSEKIISSEENSSIIANITLTFATLKKMSHSYCLCWAEIFSRHFESSCLVSSSYIGIENLT